MRKTFGLGLVVVLATVFGVHVGAGQETYVTVITDDEMPVTSLHTADLVLRDAGVRQSVLDVQPASDPLAIAVVLQDLDATDLPDVTRALEGAARVLADSNRQTRLVELPASGHPSIIDAVVNACGALRSAPTDRRVVLLIVRRHPNEDATGPERLTDALFRAKAALWTVEVADAKPVSNRKVDDVLAAGAQVSGALQKTVPGSTALPAAVAHVVDLLRSQYVVTYTWPDPMLSQLVFTTRHDRGAVLAPSWSR